MGRLSMEGYECRFVRVGCWVYLVVLGWTAALGMLFGTKVRYLFGLVDMMGVLLWIAFVMWDGFQERMSRGATAVREDFVGFQAVDIYPGRAARGHASTRIVVLMV